MGKVILVFAVLAVVLLGNGCANFKVDLASPHHPYDEEILYAKKKAALNKLPELEAEYYAKVTSDPDKRRLRDQIVFGLMEFIEEHQRRFNSNLYGGVAAFNAASEIAAGSLSAGAAFSTVTDTARLLGGLSAMVIGANASVGKNLLQSKATELIIDRMDSLRIAKRAEILTGLRGDASAYPLGHALLDIQDYARAGTIPAAMQAISKDNATAASKAQEKIEGLGKAAK